MVSNSPMYTSHSIFRSAAAVAGGSAGVGALVGGLGHFLGIVAPWAAGAAVVGGAAYGIYKTLDQDVVPAVDMFKDSWITVTDTVNGTGEVVSIERNEVILDRERVVDEDAIELIFQSNDWYLHKVDRGKKSVNEKSVCAIQEEWLNGKDYKAPRLNAETFVTPLKKSAQDDWNSIWL